MNCTARYVHCDRAKLKVTILYVYSAPNQMKINLIEIINILYRIYIIFSKIIDGSWQNMQQFFWWRFYRSEWCPLTLNKLQHRDFGLNKHIKWALSVFLCHSVRNEQYNQVPYFKILKLKFYRTSKPKSTKRTWSIPIRVRWKRWAYPFCAILRSMILPDKIFRFPLCSYYLSLKPNFR